MSDPSFLPNHINGGSVTSAATEFTQLVDPRTGAQGARSPRSTPDDVDRACRAAADAAPAWGMTTPGHRQSVMLELAAALLAHSAEIADVQARNTGQPLPLIEHEEVAASADVLRFFAGAARLPEGRAATEYAEGHTSFVRREPIGVVAQITPWNYPLLMAAWKIAPALATGNAVVLKPSDTTPESTLMLAEIARGIVPAGVLNVVQGDARTGEALVRHPIPSLVALTGSVSAGIAVATAAAPSLKRLHLELGGKAPAIVLPDADVESAAAQIVDAAMFNSGQDCTAACRAIVHEDVHDRFTAAAIDRTRQYTRDTGELAYGPLNSAAHLDRVTGLLSRRGAEAEIRVGGAVVAGGGYYLEPTVITGVRQQDELVQQEVFGPVLTIQSFADERDAVAMANGVRYGLAASVWSESQSVVARMTRALDFGCVWVNAHTVLTAEMPHGGFGMSGYGKDLSVYGLEEYTRIKHVMTRLELV